MSLRFLPITLGLVLFSVCVNADPLATDSIEVAKFVGVGSGTAKGSESTALAIWSKTTERDYFIRAYNPSSYYSEMFRVDAKGGVAATALTLSESASNHTYSPKLRCSYANGGWVFNTSSYTTSPDGGYHDISLVVDTFKVERGHVLVNGTITCKDQLKVAALDASSIKADDINVNMNNAADYVFDENYDLKSLREVESYVKANKHLPGVPSASEMEQNGMSVSSMSNVLLEKVEELTLHMIRLEKENEALKEKVQSLESQLK